MMCRLLCWGSCALLGLLALSSGCASRHMAPTRFSEAPGEVVLLTLDPGHFHAALVQKTMYAQVSPDVYVYAPAGPEIQDHLRQIEGCNHRAQSPTHWRQHVYRGNDFLERMLQQRPGNVVIISGNNRKKAEYITACVNAGLNVLADKPMCIDAAGYRLLKDAFAKAEKRGVLLYDVMTERSEITTILQRKLVSDPSVFGQLAAGTPDDPAIVKESVHHFFKHVAGKPIKRPAWYFDTTQQGEGIVDVTTHLIDLVLWTCFPEQMIESDRDIRLLSARRWPTMITAAQYAQVTRLDSFPEVLRDQLDESGVLPCCANGAMVFTIRGVHAKIAVRWDFQAPPGGRDTHFSIVRGTKARLIVRQGPEQDYQPELYIEPADGKRADVASALKKAIAGIEETYPGVRAEWEGDAWRVLIPDRYRIGHEAHFRQVTERYLQYLVKGRLPDWEVASMLTKYRITTTALELARQK